MPAALIGAAAVVVVSQLQLRPQWLQVTLTCAVLAAAAVAVAPRQPPGLAARPRWLGLAGLPALIAAIAAGSALALHALWGRSLSDPAPLTAAGILLVVAVPYAEEAFFRGALLRAAPSRLLPAMLASSLLFGALHWRLGPAMVLVFFGLAMIAAGLAWTLRSWALPAVLHAGVNGLATAYREEQLLYAILPLAWAIVLPVATLLERRTDGER